MNIKNILCYLILIIVVCGVYAPTLGYEYVLDDFDYIVKNKRIDEGISEAYNFFTQYYWSEKNIYPMYRPMAFSSYLIDVSLFGRTPFGGHLSNIFLYLCSILLVFYFLKNWIFNKANYLFAFCASFLFAVHPVHVEIVANIKNRDEILMLICGVLSFCFFASYLKDKKVIKIIIACLFLALSIFSKESAITFLAIYPLIHYLKLKKGEINKGNLFKLVFPHSLFFLVGGFIGVARVYIHQQQGYDFISGEEVNAHFLANSLVLSETIIERVSSIISVVFHYLIITIKGGPLVYLAGFNHFPVVEQFDLIVFGKLVAIFFISLSGVYVFFRKKSLIGFGILFWFLTLSVHFHLILGLDTYACRFLNIPVLGYCILLSALAIALLKNNFKFAGKHLKIVFIAIFVTLSFYYTFLSINRLPAWQSNYSLFTTDIGSLDNCAKCHILAANAISNKLEEGSLNEPKEETYKTLEYHYSRAGEIWDEYGLAFAELGLVNYLQQDYPEAITALKQSLKLQPNHRKSNFLMGMSYYKNNNFGQAIPYLKMAAENGYQEESSFIYLSRAICRVSSSNIENFNQAESVLLQALNYYSNNYDLILEIARINNLFKKDTKEAEKWFLKAFNLNKDNSVLKEEIANFYIQLGDSEKAKQFSEN